MSSTYNKAGLEIDQDIQHQEQVWFIERVSWGIMAEPSRVELWPDHVTYIFALPDTGNAADLVFHYKPLEFGKVRVNIRLEGYPVQAFSQFIYP